MVSMSFDPGFTVIAPSAIVHSTFLLGREDFHFEKSFPSNNIIASEGAVDTAALDIIAAEGVTNLGTGFHNSDDSGVTFALSGWAQTNKQINDAITVNKPLLSILITSFMLFKIEAAI